MPTLTPGLKFILASILPPALIPASALFLLHRFHLIQIPPSIFLGVSTLSLPFYFFFNVVKREIRDRRAARRLGARMVPRVRGRLLGNWDVIVKMNDYIRNDYFGACVSFDTLSESFRY
jgi:hypothetical protein